MRVLTSYVALTVFALGGAAGAVLTSETAIAQISVETMQSVELSASEQSGTPEGFTTGGWMAAEGNVAVQSVEADEATIVLNATGLVPDGLYTIWAMSPKEAGMDVQPAGGTPENEFRADAEGIAEKTFSVSSDNNIESIAVVYHADDMTHGEVPGEMGDVSFMHLMGDFPRSNQAQ